MFFLEMVNTKYDTASFPLFGCNQFCWFASPGSFLESVSENNFFPQDDHHHMYHVHNVDHHHHVQDYLHDYDHVQEITNMFNITTSRTITISKYASREELLQSAMKAFVVTQVLQISNTYKYKKQKHKYKFLLTSKATRFKERNSCPRLKRESF